MGSDRTNVTNEDDDFNWKSICTLTDEQILERTNDVLASGDGTYSSQQMIEMFRRGMSIITDTEVFKKFVSVNKYRDKNTYRVMRRMNVGDVCTFEYERWDAARVAASKLKADFGCVFRVNKRGYTGQKGDIQVERLK